MRKETYSAVVETGSCSMDRQRWEEKANCGHHHRTIEKAETCRQKNVGEHYVGGSLQCSALWYNSTIHNQNHERVNW